VFAFLSLGYAIPYSHRTHSGLNGKTLGLMAEKKELKPKQSQAPGSCL
jgi:hypothetical protein